MSHGNSMGLYQTLIVARRVRTPTTEELFQPELEYLPAVIRSVQRGIPASGTRRRMRCRSPLDTAPPVTTDIFARFERSRIMLEGSDPATYMSDGSDDVFGLRASMRGGGSTHIASFDYHWRLTGYWFADRAEITPGVPEYYVRGGFFLSRPSFKKTELFTIGVFASETGSRHFPGIELERYTLLDLSASLTIMGVVARFEMKNMLDEKYETVPGMYMPGTHYRFGLNWRLFD